MSKKYEKKTPTYVKVVAGILVGIMIFGAAATVITILVSQHAH